MSIKYMFPNRIGKTPKYPKILRLLHKIYMTLPPNDRAGKNPTKRPKNRVQKHLDIATLLTLWQRYASPRYLRANTLLTCAIPTGSEWAGSGLLTSLPVWVPLPVRMHQSPGHVTMNPGHRAQAPPPTRCYQWMITEEKEASPSTRSARTSRQ